tara:strand:+ start:12825 stop:14093 length:1269 start_codon:yes stop_codon:yes gene_type:complete
MRKIKIGIIGLGYVGLPVSVSFAKEYNVIGYDINSKRVNELNELNDKTLEVTPKTLKKSLAKNLILTNNIQELKSCNVYIITVPTPINLDKSPDLSPLLSATKAIGKLLSKGDIVIYESTVYPGCTEEKCVPILEKESNLLFNKDFYCGYSPERINPGDKTHTIDKIIKITSGSTPRVAQEVDMLYSSVIDAGTYMASSIKVAEAAKVIENAQRDINIAFINELAKIFNKMNIDTNDVLDAASTKWNFLNFRPGLVGGHCIGVDPFYLTSKANELGYNPEIILSGRKVNDSMGEFVANEVIQLLKNSNQKSKNIDVLIMGVTFKENCPDYRNTKVLDIINTIKSAGFSLDVFDPWVNDKLFEEENELVLYNEIPNKKYNAIIISVAHDIFRDIVVENYKKTNDSVVYDVKGMLNRKLITKRL